MVSAQGRTRGFPVMGSKATQSLGLNRVPGSPHRGNALAGWLIQEKRKEGGEKKKKNTDFSLMAIPFSSKVEFLGNSRNSPEFDLSLPLAFLDCIL